MKVYRSPDHGNRWTLWRTLNDSVLILDNVEHTPGIHIAPTHNLTTP